MFELGSSVQDTITGFSGIVVARAEWLNGCTRIAVQSLVLNDGKPLPEEWIDERQLRRIDDLLAARNTASVKSTGGPRRAPERAADPPRS